MLDNTPNQSTKFRTKNWVEIKDNAGGTYNTNSQIKFKNSAIKSSLCDYSDSYILVSETITVTRHGDNDNAKWADETNKELIFKTCAPFTDCISDINNTQIDYANDIDIAMPMYNLIEYSRNYLKTSKSLWQYYRDEPNDTIENFESFQI